MVSNNNSWNATFHGGTPGVQGELTQLNSASLSKTWMNAIVNHLRCWLPKPWPCSRGQSCFIVTRIVVERVIDTIATSS